MSDHTVKKVIKNSVEGPLLGSQERPMPYSAPDTGIGVLKTGKTRPKTLD